MTIYDDDYVNNEFKLCFLTRLLFYMLFSTLMFNLLHENVSCRRNWNCQTFFKNFKKFKFSFPYCIQHKKCIQMSTNKPSIGPVILETVNFEKSSSILNFLYRKSAVSMLKALATIPYFSFHIFPHLLIFLQFRDPTYVLNLSTKAFLQKWHI